MAHIGEKFRFDAVRLAGAAAFDFERGILSAQLAREPQKRQPRQAEGQRGETGDLQRERDDACPDDPGRRGLIDIDLHHGERRPILDHRHVALAVHGGTACLAPGVLVVLIHLDRGVRRASHDGSGSLGVVVDQADVACRRGV